MKEVMGVIGYPIGHSLSPLMHEAAFKALNLELAYHAFSVHPDEVGDAVHGIRSLGFRGINVTIPHKVSVIPYLDEIDELAREIGAVNTIVNTNGRLKGYNTDGEGFVRSLIESEGSIRNKKVLMIGAGGAAKGVTLALAKHGIHELVITNRTISKGEELADNCSRFVDCSVLSLEEVAQKLGDFDLIINSTSIGMHPNEDAIPLTLENLSSNALVCDLIYTPLKTKLLKVAEEKGARILNGVEMFVYQGALAFERWTDEKAPVDVMRQAVLRQLGGK